MKRFFLVYLGLVALCVNISAQRSVGMTLAGVDKPQKIYIGQYADNMRDRTGTAMQLYKDGGIYIGDFLNGKQNGLGMYVTATGKYVNDLPGTIAFVGEWIKGKKNGRGTCYGADGEIVYSGNFIDDQPVETYPMIKVNNDHYFTDWQDNLSGEFYIGEMLNGRPDGFGIYLLRDGGRSIGRVKKGHRIGLSAIIYNEVDWMVVKYDPVANGYETIYTSMDVNNRKAQYDRVQGEIRAQLRKDFSELADEGMKLAGAYVEMKTGQSGSMPSSVGYGTSVMLSSNNSTPGSYSKSSNNSKYSSDSKSKENDCGSAWISASRVYSDYETQLVANGNRSADTLSHCKEIQKKMRQLRQKWEARGCHITKSPYEDKIPL